MKPIGYWLNRTDKALTHHMNDMLAGFGLTRIAWQVLNVIHDTPGVDGTDGTADTDIRSILDANADPATLTEAIDAVLAGGWAARPAPGRLTLTPEGRWRLTDVAVRIDAFRELAMTGIPLDEYHTAVRVLERMCHNLEAPTSGGR
ncbi:MarR family winged helix-turn-helix transcriptional regulator [Streptomyces sp. NPDC021749]|uniref:MarR family winged helix-turn-helix transcriptional regulator n=1 Tax=Streptomyces sp. NPDC021749 TaxID=3154905 RepID=UPI0033F98279